MIEKTVINYLRGRFPGEIIEGEVPKGMPDRFVTVEKTGSQQLSVGLFRSTIAVQSWETSRLKAATLSEAVCKALRDMPFYAEDVTKAIGSDYDFTDTTTKRYRYQAVFTVTHY